MNRLLAIRIANNQTSSHVNHLHVHMIDIIELDARRMYAHAFATLRKRNWLANIPRYDSQLVSILETEPQPTLSVFRK